MLSQRLLPTLKNSGIAKTWGTVVVNSCFGPVLLLWWCVGWWGCTERGIILLVTVLYKLCCVCNEQMGCYGHLQDIVDIGSFSLRGSGANIHFSWLKKDTVVDFLQSLFKNQKQYSLAAKFLFVQVKCWTFLTYNYLLRSDTGWQNHSG